MLRPLTELCESTGCTVLVVHHCKQARKVGDPTTLEDLAGSGFAEFSAQWLLVSRRRSFEPGTGHHELWLTTGSRAGDQGLWELDIDESAVDQPGDRRWKTAVRAVTSSQTLADERFVAASEDRNLRRRAIAFERQCQRTLELLSAYPDGRTARFIRDTLGMSGDRINRVLDSLIEKGHAVRMEDRLIDRRRPIVTYARVQVTDLSETAIKATGLPGPDPMTYDIGTGQFVGRGNAPAPGAAGVRGAGTRPAAAGSTCLNLDLIRQLEQGLGQPVGNEAPASHPQPEEPLLRARLLCRQPPGSEASSGAIGTGHGTGHGTRVGTGHGTRDSLTSRRASDSDGQEYGWRKNDSGWQRRCGNPCSIPFPKPTALPSFWDAQELMTTAEPSAWETCASPTSPMTTRSSEARSHPLADKPPVQPTVPTLGRDLSRDSNTRFPGTLADLPTAPGAGALPIR